MTRDNLLARVGVFVGVLVLVVAVSVAGAVTTTNTAPDVQNLSVDSFTSDDSVAAVPEETGELSMTADAADTVVVIDASHSGKIDREALTPLVETLTENGATVTYHVGEQQGGQPLNKTLRQADAFVAFGAEQRYTEGQLSGLQAFSDAGGRILLLNEPEQASYGSVLVLGPSGRRGGISSPMVPLTSQYGFAYGNGYLYNMQEYDTNYRSVYATPTGDSPLTEGVEKTVFYESVPVSGGNTVLTATEQTTLSQTRRQAAYGVVARSGNVIAVGDTSIVSQEFLYRADNEVLVGNILDFLVTGEKTPANAPQPPESPDDSERSPTPPRQ